ncbi:MAG TPA: PDDEXK nuclease domain-containing protein [Ilumatobacteraceae bacterium]|nr:PDDEXK nuclease domain-containing protein [Ilumatobacteraceae bacterium]
MTEKSPALVEPPEGYTEWLAGLKSKVYAAQQRAALAVNTEMLQLYWQIGREIRTRQEAQGWGRKITERLSQDLRSAFPDMKGFSRTNLDYMRSFADAWPEEAISQQAVGKLPWGHNLVLLTKLKSTADRLSYADAASRHGWSRNVLTIQIERRVLERQGKAITNFDTTIPAPDSDLARESLKDPYRLDFLGLGEEAEERAVEDALIEHVTEFLLELGAGFAFVGRQVHLEVGGDDFWLDLLFYQVKLHRYVVIELKADRFKPEHLGQLGFYMTAVDRQLRDPATDGNTIGLLLCKSKNEVVAEYALEDNSKPLGIAEYRLVESLPEPLQTALPTIEQIERELGTST